MTPGQVAARHSPMRLCRAPSRTITARTILHRRSSRTALSVRRSGRERGKLASLRRNALLRHKRVALSRRARGRCGSRRARLFKQGPLHATRRADRALALGWLPDAVAGGRAWCMGRHGDGSSIWRRAARFCAVRGFCVTAALIGGWSALLWSFWLSWHWTRALLMLCRAASPTAPAWQCAAACLE